jgi:hypothetical protein
MISKGMAWGVFGGLFVAAAAGTYFVWDWVAYGHLSARQFDISSTISPAPSAGMPQVDATPVGGSSAIVEDRGIGPEVEIVSQPVTSVRHDQPPPVQTVAPYKAARTAHPVDREPTPASSAKIVATNSQATKPVVDSAEEAPAQRRVEPKAKPTTVAKKPDVAPPVKTKGSVATATKQESPPAIEAPVYDDQREAERLAEEDRRAFQEARRKRLQEERRRRRRMGF